MKRRREKKWNDSLQSSTTSDVTESRLRLLVERLEHSSVSLATLGLIVSIRAGGTCIIRQRNGRDGRYSISRRCQNAVKCFQRRGRDGEVRTALQRGHVHRPVHVHPSDVGPTNLIECRRRRENSWFPPAIRIVRELT